MLTVEQIEKLSKIMGLTALINEQGKYCTFMNFSGHIDMLEIRIRKSKKNYSSPIADCELSLSDRPEYYQSIGARMDQIIQTLEKFLMEDNIPYEYLEKIERIEYDYIF